MALRNLLPVELLILLCLLFLTLFVVAALFLYSRRRQSIVRATSNLQIEKTQVRMWSYQSLIFYTLRSVFNSHTIVRRSVYVW